MNFSDCMPTRVLFGRGCVKEHASLLAPLGSRALIVTGRSSALNGSLSDMVAALAMNGQTYTLFNGVRNNPSYRDVAQGLSALKEGGADFVVAIGGGSPMDAAKAIALLAVQPREERDLFAGGYEERALPMAHVPTTAGTGSEVTQYAVLTDPAKKTKTSVTSPALFPRLAFLDGAYTQTLPEESTVNTALDAFSHAAESLLSVCATPVSRMYAKESLSRLYPLLPKTRRTLTLPERDELLFCSMLAGQAIARTGTTIVHGMGYQLTFHRGIDHGRANALLLGGALALAAKKGISALCDIEQSCGADAAEIAALLCSLLERRESFTREELLFYAKASQTNKNLPRSLYRPTPEELEEMFLALL